MFSATAAAQAETPTITPWWSALRRSVAHVKSRTASSAGARSTAWRKPARPRDSERAQHDTIEAPVERGVAAERDHPGCDECDRRHLRQPDEVDIAMTEKHAVDSENHAGGATNITGECAEVRDLHRQREDKWQCEHQRADDRARGDGGGAVNVRARHADRQQAVHRRHLQYGQTPSGRVFEREARARPWRQPGELHPADLHAPALVRRRAT
jgi:hypothetical protein